MIEERREPSLQELNALLPPEAANLIHEAYSQARQSEADLASYERIGRWLKPTIAVPCILFALVGFAIVGVAVATGETSSFQKYSARIILRAVEPSAYWFSVGAYGALAAFFGLLGVRLLRRAGTKRRET